MGILLSNKEKQTTNSKMDHLRINAKEEYILFDSIRIKFWKRQNQLTGTETVSGTARGLKVGRSTAERAEGNFLRRWKCSVSCLW